MLWFPIFFTFVSVPDRTANTASYFSWCTSPPTSNTLRSTPNRTSPVEANLTFSEIPQRSGSWHLLSQPLSLSTCTFSQHVPLDLTHTLSHISRAFSTFMTFILITTNSPSLGLWTTFLGLTSAAFSAAQYLPQLQKTWNLKLVGSLSIATMCIQSPGAVLMCLSIAIRCVLTAFKDCILYG